MLSLRNADTMSGAGVHASEMGSALQLIDASALASSLPISPVEKETD